MESVDNGGSTDKAIAEFVDHVVRIRKTAMNSVDFEAWLHKRTLSLFNTIVNTPHAGQFNHSVAHEMTHHTGRWGDEMTRPPSHFQAVITYILGKLTKAIWDGDREKYDHHLVTIAAVAGTAHKLLHTEGSYSHQYFE